MSKLHVYTIFMNLNQQYQMFMNMLWYILGGAVGAAVVGGCVVAPAVVVAVELASVVPGFTVVGATVVCTGAAVVDIPINVPFSM